MKNEVINIIQSALSKLGLKVKVELTEPKSFGDFATNVAMKAAAIVKKSPIEMAELIVNQMQSDTIDHLEIAKPGFINIFLSTKALANSINDIIDQGSDYGRGSQSQFINIEYVSANPTGYLHLGHARGAAIGSSLAAIQRFAGNKVDEEFYVNDAGNQINTLGLSAFIRYQQSFGKDVTLPEDSYIGQDVVATAAKIREEIGDKYVESNYSDVADFFKLKARLILLEIIKEHLLLIGVKMDRYYSEQSLYDEAKIMPYLSKLKNTYQKDGATWLKTTDFGDDKDRVLVKGDGNFTYFLPDIAYHAIKAERGYDKLIDVWGADHSGYILRMKKALTLLGYKEDILDVLTLQMVKLMKGGKELKMSKRLGTSFTLVELFSLIGKDATRFYMVSNSNNTSVAFDVESVSNKSNSNPVFTIQYTHARCNQLLAKSKQKIKAKYYKEEKALELIRLLMKFPSLVSSISLSYKVHLLPKYLSDLSHAFNTLYTNVKMIGHEHESSWIALAKATQQTIANGLNLIGVSAPTKM